ncbi:DciA family protein [Streptomyces sp. NPDC087297]|uniref:DciA family protein n=1 Tax=Streptomyces sp. NPDC087297 TaxID=3365778 RepID=UPI00381B85A7
MTTTLPSGGGADLARIALRQAKEAARRRGTQAAKPKASIRIHRSNGRDPKVLAGVLDRWLVDSGWEKDAQAGDLLQRWPEIVGAERAHHWRAAAYDKATRTLTVLCESPSWAATLSMLSKQVIDEVNRALGAGSLGSTASTTLVLTAIKVRRASGARRSPDEAPAAEAPRRRPLVEAFPANLPNDEYAESRDRVRQAKLERDAARAPRYVPFTPLRIQGASEDHPEARYLEENLAERTARAADVERRALRQARADRAARKAATLPTSPQRTELRGQPERIP